MAGRGGGGESTRWNSVGISSYVYGLHVFHIDYHHKYSLYIKVYIYSPHDEIVYMFPVAALALAGTNCCYSLHVPSRLIIVIVYMMK